MSPGTRRLPLDGAVVPGLLLLVARDLLLHDPPRVLAWRLLHDPRFASPPPWLAALLPRPSPGLDRDPAALLLGAVAALGALAYLAAALGGARERIRSGLIAGLGLTLVVLPCLAFVALGAVTGRPHGQDGGVVQLPLALDKILRGQSPYGADYSDSILGKEARASGFWAERGGNPILRHHAYLPGTHALMLPFHLLSRAAGRPFDPRVVTLIAFGVAGLLAARLARGPEERLAALAVAWLNPLAYWHQTFGANDILVVGLLLLATLLAARERRMAAATVLGLACACKQLAWPYAPFLLLQLCGARGLGELRTRGILCQLGRLTAVSAGVFLLVVAPVALLDLRAFWGDIVAYNVGLPGADNYPLGGTPGFGLANLFIYSGRVTSLKDDFPAGAYYALLLPLGMALARRQLRERSAASALLAGSVAMVAALYGSRVVHANYLLIPGMLLPVARLMGARLAPDAVVVPLLLLAAGAEITGEEVYRAAWQDGVDVRLPQHLAGAAALLAPRPQPGTALDPLGLGIGALAAGLGLVYLVVAALGASERARGALQGVALMLLVALPSVAVVRIGQATGQARVQEPWAAAVMDAAREARDVPWLLPPRQAWSMSFQRDPPAALDLAEGRGWGARLLGALLGRASWDDARVATVAAGLLTYAALGLPPVGGPLLVAGAALLGPASVVGIPFGASDALLLCGLLAATRLARRGNATLSALVVAFAVVALPRGLEAWPGAAAPGLGLPNLFCYWGAERAPFAATLAWLLPWAALGTAVLVGRRLGADLGAALGAVGVVTLASGISAQEIATPLALLTHAALRGEDPSRT